MENLNENNRDQQEAPDIFDQANDFSAESESQESSILSPRTKGRRVKDIDALSEEEKDRLERRNKGINRLLEIEITIVQLIEIERQNGGNFRGTGARQAAAKKLGVSVWTIDNYIKRYKEEPKIESLIDQKRGRTPGGTFTKKQQEVVAYYCFNPEKQIVDSNQKTQILKGVEGVGYVRDVLNKHAPEPRHSDDAIRRFIRLLKRDKPLAASLAHKGKKYFESKVLPSRRNDPELPNDRWQIDARPLPLYIIHDDLICTVTLLLIIDDLSQCPIRARLIPRKLRDEKGMPKRSDFNAADVGILFASAIYYSGVCPKELYNDNGKQIIAIEDFLGDISEENQAIVKMTKSIPRRPRARGKVENMLKMFNDLIKDLPGNLVGKENDFDAIVEARNCKDLSSLEVLQRKCDAFINKLCNEPRRKGEKRTRIEIWSDPKGTRKAPPIRKLMNLVPERIARDTAIDYWHFQLGNKEYEPRLKNEKDLYRWMIAAVRDEFVPLRAAKLDEGWECDICLDREDGYWCEGVLKTEQYLPREKYPNMLNNVLSRAIQEHNDLVDKLRGLMSELGLDRVYKHEISKKPVMISDSVAENTPRVEGSADPSENLPPKQDSLEDASNNQFPKTSSVSVRTARSRKAPESGGRRFDWSRVPKAADTLSRIEREMRDDEEDT